MILETKNGRIVLTEIKNVNGSMDDDSKFKEAFLNRIKSDGRISAYKNDYFGCIVRERGTLFKMDFTEVGDSGRYTGLLKMFEQDKEGVIENGSRLSIFLIK